jgi:hypothetical protein
VSGRRRRPSGASRPPIRRYTGSVQWFVEWALPPLLLLVLAGAVVLAVRVRRASIAIDETLRELRRQRRQEWWERYHERWPDPPVAEPGDRRPPEERS